MHVATRRVHFAGCTTNPHTDWMKQAARELTHFEDGSLNGKRYLIMDRDGKFRDSFRAMLEDEGVQCAQLPPRSPNLNPHLERFFGSLKAETLGPMIFFGEKMLRQAISLYLDHYHRCRNHQGLENRLLEPGEAFGRIDGEIQCRERLGGLLKYYYRYAAYEPSTGDKSKEASDCCTRRAMETASTPPVYRATTIRFRRDANSEMRSKLDCLRAFRSVELFDPTGCERNLLPLWTHTAKTRGGSIGYWYK